jgi:hypothetical protein
VCEACLEVVWECAGCGGAAGACGCGMTICAACAEELCAEGEQALPEPGVLVTGRW